MKIAWDLPQIQLSLSYEFHFLHHLSDSNFKTHLNENVLYVTLVWTPPLDIRSSPFQR